MQTTTNHNYFAGQITTPIMSVPAVRTTLDFYDRLGSWKVRWGMNRNGYLIEPGLYAVGTPDADSHVLVSANYKMSFDRLRSQLTGRNLWILVLDTKGVNVWCAAGKGTFGTDELINRLQLTNIEQIVSHRKLIVPQLGATGVSAHKIKEATGFRVHFGPIRAEDLPRYLDNRLRADDDMRRVNFPFRERAILVPIDLVLSAKYALMIAAGMILLSGFQLGGYGIERIQSVGLPAVALIFLTYLAAAILPPLLLPYLPGRSFSAKGAWLGVTLVFLGGAHIWYHQTIDLNWGMIVAWILIVPSVCSFMSMNFTGATTFTSLSGVKKEMKIAVPIQIASFALGIIFWLVGLFVS